MTAKHSDGASRWPVHSVGELAVTIQYGYTAKATTDISGPKYLRITDIQNDSVDWFSVPSCEIEREDISKYALGPGDLVFARTGATVGKSFLIRPDVPQAVFASYLIRIRFKADVDPRYVAYFFQSPAYWRQISESQAGIGQPNVNGKKLAQVELPVAPVAEQRRIVAEIEEQLSRLDAAVANLTRVKANLKRYKAAVLKAAVEGELLGGSVSEGWRRAHIADVARIISGFTKSPKRAALPRKLPYLRVANVYANELRLNEMEYIGVADSEIDKFLVQRDDLLVVEGNGSADQIGRVALWDGSIAECVHQNHLIKVRFGADVLPRWALTWFLSPGGRHEIEQVSSSTSGLHTLSTGKIGRMPIPVPPLAVQRRIVAEVDRRLSIVGEGEAALERNVVRATALKAASLNQHFGSNGSSTNG